MNDSTTIAFNALAEKLGVATEHLWGVVISQAPFSLFFEFSMLLVVIIAFYLSIHYARKSKEQWEEEGNEEFTTMTNLVLLAIGLLLVISSLIFSYNLITVIFNPEYWALKTILSGG